MASFKSGNSDQRVHLIWLPNGIVRIRGQVECIAFASDRCTFTFTFLIYDLRYRAAAVPCRAVQTATSKLAASELATMIAGLAVPSRSTSVLFDFHRLLALDVKYANPARVNETSVRHPSCPRQREPSLDAPRFNSLFFISLLQALRIVVRVVVYSLLSDFYSCSLRKTIRHFST